MNLIIIKLQIIYTAILAGMMLMYSITLGSYFNFILKNKMFNAFRDYSLFRKNSKVQLLHTIVLVGQAIYSVISLIINHKLGLFPLLIAALIPIIMLAIHLLSGFAKVESLVNSSQNLGESTVKKYLQWNIPLHILYTLLYVIGCISLFFVLG